MKVLICGSRHYSDYGRILGFISSFRDITVISGGARGADTLAVRAAVTCGFDYREYPAHWKRYGKKAGPMRNQLMLDIEKPDFVAAFHPDIEKSKGTKDMLNRAKNQGVPFIIFS